MPEVSRFFGIVIYINFRDHNPAHFDAKYGEFKVTIEIETGIATGEFPKGALKQVREWYGLHKDELADDWRRARARQPLKSIAPLE